LIRRGQEPQKGEWSLPGGALELGETLDEGVRREVLEETGLMVEPVRVVAVLDRIVLDEAERVRYHYVLVDSLCRVVGGSLCCATDAVEARWVPRDELREGGVYHLGDVTLSVIEKGFEG
jgi:ADP-ribose pyrophosphatase YjhB (NUDIX family)